MVSLKSTSKNLLEIIKDMYIHLNVFYFVSRKRLELHIGSSGAGYEDVIILICTPPSLKPLSEVTWKSVLKSVNI